VWPSLEEGLSCALFVAVKMGYYDRSLHACVELSEPCRASIIGLGTLSICVLGESHPYINWTENAKL
jgi:hypothetical protein